VLYHAMGKKRVHGEQLYVSYLKYSHASYLKYGNNNTKHWLEEE